MEATSRPPWSPLERRTEVNLRKRQNIDPLRVLLERRDAQTLNELEVQLAYVEMDPPQHASNTREALALLAASPHPSLQSLALIERSSGSGDPEAEGCQVFCGCAHLADAIWPSLPALTRLHLAGIQMLHSIEVPILEQLVLTDLPLCPSGTWVLPSLRSLDWGCFYEAIGVYTDCDFEDFDLLWKQDLPSLRDLTLRGSFFGKTIQDPLILRFIARLERLCIPTSLLPGGDLAGVRHVANELAHLSTLLVTGVDPAQVTPEIRGWLPNLVTYEGGDWDRAKAGLDLLAPRAGVD